MDVTCIEDVSRNSIYRKWEKAYRRQKPEGGGRGEGGRNGTCDIIP